MKSKNNLSLTGAVASDVTVLPNSRNGSFTLIHHFGGPGPPLVLQCVFEGKTYHDVLALGLKKGDAISIEAFVRPRGKRMQAVLKGLTIIPGEKTIVQPEGD